MKKRMLFTASIVTLVAVASVVGHPHFRKTVSASVKGLDLKVQYSTVPYNPVHLKDVKDGFLFHCGRAKVTVEGEMSSGGQKISAGSYLLRAQAKSVDDWTFYLIPEASAGDPNKPDVSKGIALETQSLTGQPNIAHLDVNLTGGHGPTDGKLVLSVAFGPRRIEGIITLPAA